MSERFVADEHRVTLVDAQVCDRLSSGELAGDDLHPERPRREAPQPGFVTTERVAGPAGRGRIVHDQVEEAGVVDRSTDFAMR